MNLTMPPFTSIASSTPLRHSGKGRVRVNDGANNRAKYPSSITGEFSKLIVVSQWKGSDVTNGSFKALLPVALDGAY